MPENRKTFRNVAKTGCAITFTKGTLTKTTQFAKNKAGGAGHMFAASGTVRGGRPWRLTGTCLCGLINNV